MKRLFAMVLALSMLLGMSAALAATVYPITPLDIDEIEPLPDEFEARVGFSLKDVTERGVYIQICDEMCYAAADIDALRAGDTILYLDEEIVVRAIEGENGKSINGGYDNGGVTLWLDEDGNYVPLEYESPVFVVIDGATVEFTDEVVFRRWHEDEDGAIADDMLEITVPAAEVKNALAETGYDDFGPAEMVALFKNEKLAELTLNYTP